MQTGAGNSRAIGLASASPLVQSARKILVDRLRDIRSSQLRTNLTELMDKDKACIRHRAGLQDANKQRIVEQLTAAGLMDPADGASIEGGLIAGVFPGIEADGSDCPRMPQAFFSAPGGATGGHHSEPGGLPVHEAFNGRSAASLAKNYRTVYGSSDKAGFPTLAPPDLMRPEKKHQPFVIDEDIVAAAPLWHDWAKTIVFQWNADGTEFRELNFGGNGKTDNNGAAGDSKTGAHHILGLAEALKRGMPADFVLTVASAHANPTYGNEYKVVNWIRAASIIAQIDPFAQGYLRRDDKGAPRLPSLRQLGSMDLNAASGSEPNVLLEYVLHNLSDADYIFTGPAASTVAVVLEKLAPEYGYDSKQLDYLFKYRHVAFTYLSAERLFVEYSNGGLDAVRAELDKLRKRKLI